MKKTTIILLLIFTITLGFSQSQEAYKLMKEGIVLHDKGKYKKAIKKYDKALKIEPKNISFLYEKASSLTSLKEYKKAIKVCKKCIKINPNSVTLKQVYTVYANSTDLIGKPKKAIEIYNEAIKKFPDYYHLYFNRGITEIQNGMGEEAVKSFETSTKLNPKHASSHNALAITLNSRTSNIPKLFVGCRFLILEPETKRSTLILPMMQRIVLGKKNVKKTDDNSISISFDGNMLSDSGEIIENDFSSVNLILLMSSALNMSEENENKTEIEKFISTFETVVSMVSETKKDNYGYYWEHFVPYYVEMKEKGFLETFAYIIHASEDKKNINKWLKKNGDKIEEFYKWSSEYEWK